jgi:hypothetical protein
MSLVSEWPVLNTMPSRIVNKEMAKTSSRLAAAITNVDIPLTDQADISFCAEQIE